MPTYIILSKWTDQGVRNVDQVADRERGAKQAAADMSGTHTVYFTLGEYDAVNIVEAPDETAAASYALEISSHGNIRTTTMRAFTQTEFLALLKTRRRWEIGAEGDLSAPDRVRSGVGVITRRITGSGNTHSKHLTRIDVAR